MEKTISRLNGQVELLERQKAEDLKAKITEIVKNQSNLQTSQTSQTSTESGNRTHQIFVKQSDQASQLTKIDRESTIVKQKPDKLNQRTAKVIENSAEDIKKLSEKQTSHLLSEFGNKPTFVGKKQTDQNGQLTKTEKETTIVLGDMIQKTAGNTSPKVLGRFIETSQEARRNPVFKKGRVHRGVSSGGTNGLQKRGENEPLFNEEPRSEERLS
eukprot:TRINITY_DN1788_c1_g3_i4.p2 TRINITY_DN1788_c1_g3~~TRINITY_DN1788_c1_g3_i4.p2  ORF type:complete len:214 (+),score=29.83 TRINITY_DN1788_c1_g3_i4:843-1484(+)